MDNGIAVLIEFQSLSQREIVIKLLTREARPDFDDELPDDEVPFFNLLEDVEFPNQMLMHGNNQIFIDWWDIQQELCELDEKMVQCGGKIQKAQVFIEDGMIDPSQDGLYYKRINNELVVVDSENRKLIMPDDFPKESDIPQQMQVLLQEF